MEDSELSLREVRSRMFCEKMGLGVKSKRKEVKSKMIEN